MSQSATNFKGSICLRRIIESRVRAGIGRRRAAHAATATAAVLATVDIISNAVIAAASSVFYTDGGRRVSDWEEEQVLSHMRIDFDDHIKRIKDRNSAVCTACRKPTS
jgi:hypothetical protein